MEDRCKVEACTSLTRTLLRYVLNDDKTAASKAAKILEQEEVLIPFEVVSEIVYVLLGVYAVPRKEISSSLSALFSRTNLLTTDRDVLFEALELLASSKLDFVDCLLIGYHRVRGHNVHTFDKHLARRVR